jgi:hypothetical protein
MWGQPFWAAAALSGGVAVYERFLSLVTPLIRVCGHNYDHLVRDSKSLDRIRHYIEWRPVKGCLNFALDLDAAQKGGGSPKGLTPQVACKS